MTQFQKRKSKAFELCRNGHAYHDVEQNDMSSSKYHDNEYRAMPQESVEQKRRSIVFD
jgi:hypothetical protein